MIKIMIVDDEFFEREAFKMLIKNKMKDCEVISDFENGKDALDYFEKNDVDLIFMDIKMPIMDGIEATRLIKEADPNQYVIILTAYADFELAQQAVKINANDYLLKPSRPEKIEKAIERFTKYTKKSAGKKKVDYVKDFKHAFIKGHYMETVSSLDKIKEEDLGYDELSSRMTQVLSIIRDVAEYFNLNFSTSTRKAIDDHMTLMKRRNEYYQLIDRLIRDMFTQIVDKKLGKYEEELDFALDYIELNLTEHVTLEDVSGYMNISAHYFSKIFKRDMDINFVQYVTGRKVEHAKRLLSHSSQPIINIAYDLGFNEANYFSKVFKKSVGQTPSQYRNALKQK